MKTEQLKAEERKLTGKKVRKLRKEDVLPANIYGKNFNSTNIQLPIKDFEDVYAKSHETGVVELTIGKNTYPVLIHNVQRNPISRYPIHVDFYKVNLKEKVKTTIPVVSAGEAKADKDKTGTLMQALNEVEVEALPTDLPEHIEVNVENLAEVDDHILVSDIKPPSGVTILTDEENTVFRIAELVSQEAEELEAEEAAEAEAASEEGEKAEESEGESTEEQPAEETEKKE